LLMSHDVKDDKNTTKNITHSHFRRKTGKHSRKVLIKSSSDETYPVGLNVDRCVKPTLTEHLVTVGARIAPWFGP
jgi:hypothetical protein